MTDPERTSVAESLLMVIMALREDNGSKGGAWTLAIATTFASRAILAQVGPRGDAAPLLALLTDQIAAALEKAQLQYARDALTAPPSGNGGGPRRIV